MKKFLFAILCLFLFSCGDDAPSFSGVWSGAFRNFDNTCPFTVVQTLPDLFPMVVTEDPPGVFTVTAANGNKALGAQGEGEDISFIATAPSLGDFGSTFPYLCKSTYNVSYLSTGDNNADINVSVSFTDCVSPQSTEQISECFASYNWDGTKS